MFRLGSYWRDILFWCGDDFVPTTPPIKKHLCIKTTSALFSFVPALRACTLSCPCKSKASARQPNCCVTLNRCKECAYKRGRQGGEKLRGNVFNWTQLGYPLLGPVEEEVLTWRGAKTLWAKIKIGHRGQGRVCMCLQAVLYDLKVKCFENLMQTHLFFSSSLCVDLQRQKTEVVK